MGTNKNESKAIDATKLFELAALASAIVDKVNSVHAMMDSVEDLGNAESLAELLYNLLRQEAENAMA